MGNMNFVSMRELRNSTNRINEMLTDDGKIIITSKGKPKALMIQVNEADFEETLNDLRQVRGLRALRALQSQAKANGLSDMTLDDINAEIAEARRESREKIDKSGVNGSC